MEALSTELLAIEAAAWTENTRNGGEERDTCGGGERGGLAGRHRSSAVAEEPETREMRSPYLCFLTRVPRLSSNSELHRGNSLKVRERSLKPEVVKP